MIKNMILCFTLFIIPTNAFCQNYYNVYDTDQYGFKQINPSQIIERNNYNHNRT